MKLFKQFIILCIVINFCLSNTDLAEDGIVQILTDKTFDDFINNNEHVFVKFFTEWCGHCKQLKPEFTKAAKELDGTIVFAQVDITTEKAIADRYNIQGIPDLRFFTQQNQIKYSGERTKDEMIMWLEKKMINSIQELNYQEDFDKILSDSKIVVCFFGKKESNTKEYDLYQKISKKFDDLIFLAIDSEEIQQQHNVQSPSIVLFKSFDEKRNDYTGDLLNENAIIDFITEYMYPLVSYLDDKMGDRIFGERQTAMILLIKEGDDELNNKVIEQYEKAAEKLRGKIIISFTNIEEDLGSRLSRFIGVVETDLPKIAIIDPSEDLLKYFMQTEITQESIVDFFDQYVKNLLKPDFKSQDIPTENNGLVQEIVGKNFEEVVFDESKSVIVFFYAPWCGHSKAFLPIYNEVAQKLNKHDNLLFTKLDATENEVPGQNIEGFPTLRLYLASLKEPIEYEGERDSQSLIDFLKDKVQITSMNQSSTSNEKQDKSSETNQKDDL